MLVTKQVRSLLSWSIPQQSLIHPGDRFTPCEFDQAAVKVGFWTNWTACWVNHSTSKRSLHITLFSQLYPISLFWAMALFTCIQNQMENKIASNKTEVFFPVKMYKNRGFISFLKSSYHYITSRSADFLFTFLLLFSFPLNLPAEHWTAWTWIKTIPRQPRSLSWCHVLLITGY